MSRVRQSFALRFVLCACCCAIIGTAYARISHQFLSTTPRSLPWLAPLQQAGDVSLSTRHRYPRPSDIGAEHIPQLNALIKKCEKLAGDDLNAESVRLGILQPFANGWPFRSGNRILILKIMDTSGGVLRTRVELFDEEGDDPLVIAGLLGNGVFGAVVGWFLVRGSLGLFRRVFRRQTPRHAFPVLFIDQSTRD